MGHGAEHHIEHAEHAAHAAHDEFNKIVTMTIAIVAAVLACVTMLSHRSHNETLLLQGDALRLQGEALQLQTLGSRGSTETANKWAYYQAKNLFHLESRITVDLLSVLATDPSKQTELEKLRKQYHKDVVKYDERLPKIEDEARELSKNADEFMKKADEKLAEAQHKMEESHVVHAKTTRYDFGELGLQFGVVLCSLAILTKSRSFWIAGIVSALIGALIALSGVLGLFLGHH